MKRMMTGAVGLILILFAVGFVASTAKADTITRTVGEAGVVTFSTDGGVLTLLAAESAEGWTYTVDRQDGTHLKVTFRDAAGSEVEFEAEFEDGAVTVGNSDDPGSTTTIPGDGTTTSTTLDDSGSDDRSTTSTTGDDHSDDDDSSDADDDSSDADDDSDDADDDSDDDADDDSDDADDDSDDADDDSDDADDDSDDDGSAPDSGDGLVALDPATYVVGSAGTVSVHFAGGEVLLAAVTTADGWTYEVDHMGGSHVEVEFVGPDGAELEFRVDADGEFALEG